VFSTYFHGVLNVQDVRVDTATRRVWRAESEIVFSRKEFDLLHHLMERAGQIVSRDELMNTVWNTNFWTSSKTIDVHLGWVRRKLGDDPSQPTLITTVRGHGLRFELEAPAYAAAPLQVAPPVTIQEPMQEPIQAIAVGQ
jgi:DNA-binding response OmpR family regulator